MKDFFAVRVIAGVGYCSLVLLFHLVKIEAHSDEHRTVLIQRSDVTDAELQTLSRKLHSSDVNAVAGIDLNLQGQTTSGSYEDLAPVPLFTSVPSNALNGPTIQALLALYDNYVLDCTVTEVPTPQKNAENDAFLNAMMVTSVMQQAHTFLASKGLADADPIVFAEYLRTIWMGFYNRGGGINSSSGLEHVFLGEIDGNKKIQGLHSWIRFYLEEKNDYINYLGYITNISLGTGGVIDFPLSWRGLLKALDSISLSSSPELDIALATVCFLARPNTLCPLQGANGVAYNYQTYELVQNGVTYIGSAYPTTTRPTPSVGNVTKETCCFWFTIVFILCQFYSL